MGHSEEQQAGHQRRPLTVGIVDDHEIVRDGIRWLLAYSDDLTVVAEAADVDDGLEVTLKAQPDVVIVDSKLPGGRGVDLVRSIRSRIPETRCLILTSYSARGLLSDALEAGASGLVAKDVPGTVLLSAIRRVGEGGSVVDGHLDDTVEVGARPEPGTRDLVNDLTRQERRILELIAEGATNHEIADALFLAEKTVRNYVSNLLAKLGVKNRTQAATMLVGLEGRRVA